MSSHRDEDLAAALGALRPTPRAAFAAELDSRAAAGFPRRDHGGASPVRRALARFRATPPRRLLLPAGGFAVAAVAVATALIATTQNGGDRQLISEPDVTRSSTPQPPPAIRPEVRESAVEAAPAHGGAPDSRASAGASESGAAGFSQEEPAISEQSASSEQEAGPYASHAHRRYVERGARIVLGDDPSQVRDDAAQVFDAVHAANGIVLDSTIRDGSAGHAGARFELLIPAAKLSDAMASFSSIAGVVSRNESTDDITAPTVGVTERLQDSDARVRSLLNQLAAADSDAKREAAEAELEAERNRQAALRARLSGLHRRANLSHVSLRIETDASAVDEGGAWGIGNGFDDAGRILAIAAGVAVIGLAALAPFAILALLAWLARGAYVRRARAQALG
jgi:hypothetical protein